MLIILIVFLALYFLIVDEVKPQERIKKLFFPFFTRHMWHGYDDAHDLIDFLEDGAYEGDVVIDAEDVKLLSPPKEEGIKSRVRTRGGKIIGIATPVTPAKEVITEQTIEVKPVINDELEEIIADDIAYGDNGG